MFVFPRTAVWICHDGAEPFVADPNVVTFYNPGQHYTRRRLSRDGDRADWYLVAPDVMCEVAERFDPSTADRREGPLPFTHGPSGSRAYLAQRCLFEHVANSETPDELFVEEGVLSVLGDVVESGFASRAAATSHRRGHADARRQSLAEEARALLATHFASSLTLAQLARTLGVSPFHLARVFRRCHGTSLHEYRVRLRLRAALQRLTRPRTDILELALSVGFSSHSHFTTAFRQAYGKSPSAFRQAVGR